MYVFYCGAFFLSFSLHHSAQALGNVYIFHERVEPIFLWDFEGTYVWMDGSSYPLDTLYVYVYICITLLALCTYSYPHNVHSISFFHPGLSLSLSHFCSYPPSLPPSLSPSLTAKSFIEVTGEVLEFDTLSPGHCHRKTRFPNDFYPDVCIQSCTVLALWCRKDFIYI